MAEILPADPTANHDDFVSSLIHTDEPLLDSDKIWIQQDITIFERDILLINDKIASLISQRDILRRRLARYKSVLSPIRCLPRDILIEIFSRTIHPSTCSLDVSQGLWPLCHVSASWRKILLSTPSLWSTIILVPPYTFRHSKGILAEHLLRSQSHPLRVTITQERTVTIMVSQVCDMVLQASDRWLSANLNLDPFYASRRLNSMYACLPLLEDVHLTVLFVDEGTISAGRDVFSITPSLRRADLPFAIHLTPRNGDRLTHLCCTIGGLEDIQYIFQAPSLLECKLILRKADKVYDGPLICNDTIQALWVNDMDIVDILTLRALKKIIIRYVGGDDAVRTLVDFLSRSSCSLLELGVEPKLGKYLTRLSAHIQSIHRYTLYLYDDFISTDTVVALGQLEHADLMPSLDQLDIHFHRFFIRFWSSLHTKAIHKIARRRFLNDPASVTAERGPRAPITLRCSHEAADFVESFHTWDLSELQNAGLVDVEPVSGVSPPYWMKPHWMDNGNE
ncbi:hypothetical protein IW261DRAFT_1568067 [Armillaria novae-zelandiae]|uniref:F-box domain-containing protein n=1 Tax=Armillaria novae-zelandiae TaxID=153914 RepID=A0AA39P096_9AGAR|nr:hypothetical protein IW261DRAFT_1568067 [Armillaria novae-zelandiae]